MTKRKSDAEKASNRHSRKRMTFTAPKTAATKAIIKQNAESSPLLRLPVEIRREIFNYMLGDRLIHLKNCVEQDAKKKHSNRWHLLVCDPSAAESIEDEDDDWTYGGAGEGGFSLFGHLVGYTGRSPASTGDGRTAPPHDSTLLKARTNINAKGYEASGDWSSTDDSSMQEETDSDGSSENSFVYSSKRDEQMDKEEEQLLIGHLRVSYSQDEWRRAKDTLVYGPPGAVFLVFALRGTPLWSDAITMPLVRSLQGLRELWLCINARFPASYFDKEYKARCFETKYLEGARKLATLPLTRAKVSVTNSYLGNYDAHWKLGLYTQWTKEQQQEYAELIQARLLDVNGARLFQQENDVVKEMIQRGKEIQAERQAKKSITSST
ncbi:six-hairpin glycosidase [Physcia stellaris]|nr:six-hairpin glycosidase [Physcia stellaris]